MYKVVLDPAHGGSDLGAVYGFRFEKNDNLKLAFAVGALLEDKNIDVLYTRTEDTYRLPSERVKFANDSGANLLVSIERRAAGIPNTLSGSQALIAVPYGINEFAAFTIVQNLTAVGYPNLGVNIRDELIILRDTTMPALVLEVGYINNDVDNQIFDVRLDEIAPIIAAGINDALERYLPLTPPNTVPALGNTNHKKN